MSDKKKILIQLDPDAHPSVFDAVVAVDSQVDHLLQYSNVQADQVRDLVHGAIFTRGPKDLRSTAIFIGGSDVSRGEALCREVSKAFFGPMRVSVMLDSNGANSTAAAAFLCVQQQINLQNKRLLVLAATGPVGQRVCRLAAQVGAVVVAHSRSTAKAESIAGSLASHSNLSNSRIVAIGSDQPQAFQQELEAADAVVACGAAGIQLLSAEQLRQASKLQVAVDLNAVPPVGLQGIDAMDKAIVRGQRTDYGALGVGGLKMKIHKAAIAKLFTQNDLVLNAEEMVAIGREILAESR